VNHYPRQLPTQSAASQGIVCERPLRIAAAMIGRASPHMLTAATVVGVLGRDAGDIRSLRDFVHDLTQTYGLQAELQVDVGSFSVRFCHTAYPDGRLSP